jgi:hypothetical protein
MGIIETSKVVQPELWLCIGDFNEIVTKKKTRGRLCEGKGRWKCFEELLRIVFLIDLGYRGPKFTWTNCKDGNNFTKERLHRVVANRGWCAMY